MGATSTQKLWLFGHPVAHSLSPVMYNAAFAHLGLDWRYESFDIAPDDLPAAFARAREEQVIGGNVTIPHKIAAFSLMGKIDGTAHLFGAVNTYVATGLAGLPARMNALPQLTGYDTDGYGLAEALREEFQLELRGKSVAILGAGGAGQAAAMQCAVDGAREIFILNRTTEKAVALAEKVRAQFPMMSVVGGFGEKMGTHSSIPRIDLMINATSLGLHWDDPKPIVCAQLTDVSFVYDMIYRPAETKFLRCARDAGARTANGLSMLLYQGVRALELWLEKHAPEKNFRAPVEVMRMALKQAV